MLLYIRLSVVHIQTSHKIGKFYSISHHIGCYVAFVVDMQINTYRHLISKSTFMQFLAVMTFLHIWKNESQGYLKMALAVAFFCKLKGVVAP